MTDVRTFKAATMQEALDIVRREMGSDAVILHTREVPVTRFLGWSRSKPRVEITAGLGVNIRPIVPRVQARPAAAAPNPRIAPPSSPAGAYAEESLTPTAAARKPLPTDANDENASRRPPDRMLAPPPAFLKDRNAEALSASLSQRFAPVAPQSQVAAESRPAPEPRKAPAVAPPPARPAPGPRSFAPSPSLSNESQAAITHQLNSIRQMVERLSRNAPSVPAEDVPKELFHLYTDLLDAEVEDDLARELVFRLKKEGPVESFQDLEAAKSYLAGMLEQNIRCCRPVALTPGRRKVVALVGPTGVGKTTTIAKLAANYRLRDGIKMGLVTVDTYRIAAVEQLRTYAEIIDLPMKVVTGPREMRRALDELQGLDLVLIDTAGRSPRDELKIQELKSLLNEAQVDEVHLVLSLVASARSLETTAEKFAAANTTSLILTKLDEAAGMGMLLSAARKIPLPISYLTTGQNVPDDIEVAAANRITRLVLGQDSLYAKSSRKL